jgi:ribosomal protein L16 Arg81 hydroxylase
VLQVAGVKRWALFDRALPPPTSDADVKPIDVGDRPSTYTYDLKPGDVLYVPRGVVHRVQALETPAVHVSFGLKVLTVGDLVMAVVREWSGAAELRTALPPAARSRLDSGPRRAAGGAVCSGRGEA